MEKTAQCGISKDSDNSEG